MHLPHRRLLVILSLALFCCGAANSNLSEIQTAVIQEDFVKARLLAQEYLATQPHPGDPLTKEIQFYLGLSQLNMEEFTQARETFQQVIAHQPDEKLYEKAMFGVIDSYYMAGEFKEALQTAERFLKENEKSESQSLIYLKIARANLKLTNWGEAQKYLNKIIADFPNSMESHLAKQLLAEKQFFSVQVGAFLDQERSQRLAEDLKAKGEYAYIVETTDFNGRKFYRVRIGQFSNLDAAYQMKNKLAQQGYPTRIYP